MLDLANAMPQGTAAEVVQNPEYQLESLTTRRSFDGEEGYTEAVFVSTAPGTSRRLAQWEVPAGWKLRRRFVWRNRPAQPAQEEITEIPPVGEPGTANYFPGRSGRPAVPAVPAAPFHDVMRTLMLYPVITAPAEGQPGSADVAAALAVAAGMINTELAKLPEEERNAKLVAAGLAPGDYPPATMSGRVVAQIGALMTLCAEEQG